MKQIWKGWAMLTPGHLCPVNGGRAADNPELVAAWQEEWHAKHAHRWVQLPNGAYELKERM